MAPIMKHRAWKMVAAVLVAAVLFPLPGGWIRGQDAAAKSGIAVILGRPTDSSVSLSLLSGNDGMAKVEYGTARGNLASHTPEIRVRQGIAVEVVLTSLASDVQHYYRVVFRDENTGKVETGDEHAFHTQRAPGSTFTFELQGDSHPERRQMFDAGLYARMLDAVAADQPDFYIAMGDDFSVDTLGAVNQATVEGVYLRQRMYLETVGRSSPIFLVNGNHEQAALCNLNGTAGNVAVWAQNARNRLFPQPAPDGFYSGNSSHAEFIGLLRNYYAWTWGDALFVVIDPYWHSTEPVDNVFGGGQKSRNLWNVTLGDAQYQWFRRTLEQSNARYKFVFAHHVNGTGRGGVEDADLYEWGGRSRQGAWEFDRQRPGWDMPVHQLMAKNRVTVFFQGHDHIFARQEKDGVVYQTLPLPADPNDAFYNKQSYHSGDLLPGSGRLRVTVSPESVTVQYVRSCLPADATEELRDGEVAFSYQLAGGSNGTQPAASAPPTPFTLRSPAVAGNGQLPRDYTGDGTSSTLPLEWSGAPDGTRSYALVMHHVDPEGMVKWYWILYNIPPNVQNLSKNVEGVGTLGNNSVNGRTEYAPPHSKGPGPKTYVYTIYALSGPPKINVRPEEVSRAVLIRAMDGIILGSAELRVTYTRTAGTPQ